MRKQRVRLVFLAMVATMLAVMGDSAFAQSPSIWRETIPAKLVAFDTTPFGTVLVQTKSELFAVDADTGKHVWSRPDVTDYLLVSGTPFAVLTTATGKTVADLDSGQDRWKLGALGLASIKGMLHLPAAGVVLVYGPTTENPHTLVCAKYESGEVLWKQTSLFKDAALGPKAAKIVYRTHLLDTEKTVVLDPSDDGLIRLDLQNGNVLWRIPEMDLESKGKWVDLFSADNLILAAYDKKLFAIARDEGKVLWTRKDNFSSGVTQVATAPSGILVRGAFTLDSRGQPNWHPYLAVLNRETGTTKWITDKKFEGRSSFLMENNTAVIALTSGVATYDLASGKVFGTTKGKAFSGNESPCCIEHADGNRFRIWSSQNLQMLDDSSGLVYSVYLKAPGASFLAKLAVVAVAVAASSASMAAAPPGGFYQVYSPGPGSLLYAKFKATTFAERYTYIFTEEDGQAPDRFALVRVDKQSGKQTGRLKFVERAPWFRVDPASGVIVATRDNVLYAMRFSD